MNFKGFYNLDNAWTGDFPVPQLYKGDAFKLILTLSPKIHIGISLFLFLAFFTVIVNGQTNIYTENFGTTGTSFPAGWSTTSTGNQKWVISSAVPSSGYTGASGDNNVFHTHTAGGTRTQRLTYNGLSTIGYTDITVLWGANRGSNYSTTFEYSIDGSNWTSVLFTEVANDGTWALVNGGVRIVLPAETFGVSNLQFRWTATASRNNTHRIDDFTVEGMAGCTTLPVANCQDIIVQVDGSGIANITASDIDNESTADCGLQSLTATPNSFTCSNLGPNTVTLTITDVNSISATCNATVTVQDTIVPTIICPANITVNTDADLCTASGVDLGTPVTSDNCSVASVSSLTGEPYPLGDNIVSWTVADDSWNFATCNQTVTVVDNIDPVISGCPTNINVQVSEGDTGGNASWTPPTATDNCSVSLSGTHNSGDFFNVGTTTVIYTATDGTGNITTCSFNVNVFISSNACGPNFITNGSFETPATANWTIYTNTQVEGWTSTADEIEIWASGGGGGQTSYEGNQLSEMNGNSPTTFYQDIATNPGFTMQWQIVHQSRSTANETIQLKLGVPGSTVLIQTITSSGSGWNVYTGQYTIPVGQTTTRFEIVSVSPEGASGNLIDDIRFFLIENNPPTVENATENININTEAGVCYATVNYSAPTFQDDCDGTGLAGTLQAGLASGSQFPIGETTVTYTYTDIAGNGPVTSSFTVTVTDIEVPTITCPANVTVNTDAGESTATNVDLGNPTTADNCGVASAINDSSEPYPIGNTTVIWMVTDNSGNTATCEQIVTVEASEIIDIEVVDLLNFCQSGGTGTTTTITWDINKLVGTTNWTYDYNIFDGTSYVVFGLNILASGNTQVSYIMDNISGEDKTYTITLTNVSDDVSTETITVNNSDVVTVLAASVGGTAAGDQTICSGSSPVDIILTGGTGAIQWQSSPDNTTFTDIAGATSATLTSAQIGALTATSYFRAVVTSGVCPPENSNTVTITVDPASVGGTAAGDQTICSGSSPTDITLTGGTGAIQWQSSPDNTAFTNIAGATTATLTSAQTGALTATSYFRAVVTSGACPAENSNTVTITVDPASIGGTAAGDQTICSGSTPADITLTGGTGAIQWQSSPDNTTFTNIAGATTATLTSAQTGALTATSYFRAVVTSGACPAENSNTVTITVDPASVGGTAAGDQTICSGSSPADITLTGGTGAIQWQSSPDNSTFTNIAGATTATLTSAQTGALTATSYFRAVVTSGACPAENSNT
ncbi:MAG: HYR domain-containing protein, partial [Gammaproteobacteria bacterium]|nr:HYR domain-containing protein [Gammaproteobacteria bacterium]